jgi:hypothetical protein
MVINVSLDRITSTFRVEVTAVHIVTAMKTAKLVQNFGMIMYDE